MRIGSQPRLLGSAAAKGNLNHNELSIRPTDQDPARFLLRQLFKLLGGLARFLDGKEPKTERWARDRVNHLHLVVDTPHEKPGAFHGNQPTRSRSSHHD
jgi:hypothetical protein